MGDGNAWVTCQAKGHQTQQLLYHVGREFNSPSQENPKSGIFHPDSSPTSG